MGLTVPMEHRADASVDVAIPGRDNAWPPGGTATLQHSDRPEHAPSWVPPYAKWLLAAALVIAAVLAYSIYKQHEATPKPAVGIGTAQVVDFGDGKARVTLAPLVPFKPGKFYTPKGTMVGYIVTIEALSGAFGPNPLGFTLQTAADRTSTGQSLNSVTGAVADQLRAGDMKVGEKRRGSIAFDVPTGKRISSVGIVDVNVEVATWKAN